MTTLLGLAVLVAAFVVQLIWCLTVVAKRPFDIEHDGVTMTYDPQQNTLRLHSHPDQFPVMVDWFTANKRTIMASRFKWRITKPLS